MSTIEKDKTRRVRLLTIKQVVERVIYSKSHIYRLIQQGDFPKQIILGPNRVCWTEASIEEWVSARVAESLTVHQENKNYE